MSSVGMYDPDNDNQSSSMIKKSMEPKTDFQRRAFKACRRSYFKNTTERKRFRTLETPGLGATEESIMHQEWIKHNIGLVEEANKTKTIRNLAVLMSMIENQERKTDWVASNRERVMKSRASGLEDLLFDN